MREHNEDFFIIDKDVNLAIVCDGVGGHLAGEVASQLAATSICGYIRDKISSFQEKENQNSLVADIEKILKAAISEANKQVWLESQKDEKKKGMGTTLVLALYFKDLLFYAHLGDSRIYLLRDDKAEQITKDHSFINELINTGYIDQKQAAQSPFANIITKALGQEETIEADIQFFAPKENDQLLLCTDGLSDYFETDEIASFFRSKKSAEGFLSNLILKANECGGKDNITAVLAEFK